MIKTQSADRKVFGVLEETNAPNAMNRSETGSSDQLFNLIDPVSSPETCWEWRIQSHQGKSKSIKLVWGDLTELQEQCDVVVCSAFKRDYIPSYSSLIGALARKGYNVRDLARVPEEGLKFPDGWISRDTGMEYKRIACIELLNLMDDPNSEGSVNLILKKSFSTLRYMLEQAAYSNIPVKTLAMTVPGTGNQGINTCYILAPLIAHCRYLLETDIVDEITIYSLRQELIGEIIPAFNQAFREKTESPEVFISYSSKQMKIAHDICRGIRESGTECWIAPESIPEGSSYQEMIPNAISSAKIIVLILTPDAVNSRWVQKEIGSAIGARKIILPYQLMEFDLGTQFMFLLDGEQIMYHILKTETAEEPVFCQDLIQRIKTILDG